MKKLLLLLLFVSGAFALNIDSPTAKTYSGNISLEISHPEKLNRIVYLMDGIEKGSCTNCSELKGKLSPDVGSHTLIAYGYSGTSLYTDKVGFKVSSETLGLRIESPQSKAYTAREIELIFKTDSRSNMTYKLDGKSYSACTDCRYFSDDVSLSYGDHTLEVKASRGTETETETVRFTVKRTDIGLEVISPKEKEYNNRNLTLEFKTAKKANITYEIDDKEYEACEDCRSFRKAIRLSEGDHTLKVRAESGDDSDSMSVKFSIDESGTGLRIISPEAKDYSAKDIRIDIRTDGDSDIDFWIDAKLYGSCDDCSRLTDDVTLSYGWHTLTAEAGNDKKTVRFRVLRDDDDDDKDDDDYEDEKGNSKYGPAFAKLPKLLEDGDITDSELAKLLRENRIPPGIVNRLIKSGKLGDESIDAILSYQFNPPGIMMRFWGLVGWKQMSYSNDIYDRYSLNDTHREKMLQRDDLAKDKAKRIKDALEKKVKQGKSNANNSWKGGHK